MEFSAKDKSKRIYLHGFRSENIDRFYDLTEYIHDIIFNEKHNYPLGDNVPLFGNSRIAEDGLNPYTTRMPVPGYKYMIAYDIAGKPLHTDMQPYYNLVTITLECDKGYGEERIRIDDHFEPKCVQFTFNQLLIQRDLASLYDDNIGRIKDLLRLWILIPRSTKKVSQVNDDFIDLQKIYYERMKWSVRQFPTFARVQGLSEDVLPFVRENGMPQYPPSVP